jgi:Ni,Fe-hydrogenase I small subunit
MSMTGNLGVARVKVVGWNWSGLGTQDSERVMVRYEMTARRKKEKTWIHPCCLCCCATESMFDGAIPLAYALSRTLQSRFKER